MYTYVYCCSLFIRNNTSKWKQIAAQKAFLIKSAKTSDYHTVYPQGLTDLTI